MFFLLSHRKCCSALLAPLSACAIGQQVGGRSYVLSDRTPSVLGNGPEVQA